MHQLIVSSTQMEILPFIRKAGFYNDLPLHTPVSLSDDLTVQITGVGSPSTIFDLTRSLSSKTFDRIIQVGVAGSFNKEFEPGSLIEVGEDCFADLGIDNNGLFTNIYQAGLSDPDSVPFAGGWLLNPTQGITGLPSAKAITVNTTSGSKEIIDQRMSLYNAHIESMEGAAAFLVSLQFGIPVIQVRSISNYIEPRNRDSWKLDLAIQNLNNWLLNFVNISSKE